MNNIITKLVEKANSGDSQASYKLGLYYETGNFVEQDYEKAVRWYTTAIKQDENIQASERLEILQQKDIELQQLLLNTKKRILGIVYPYVGNFASNAFSAKKIKRYCYEKAVKNGNSRALCELAFLYINGIGVKQNYKKAKELLLKANEKGYKKALLPLGTIYYLENNFELAQKYWLQATKEKDFSAKAFKYLGNLFLYGLGVEQDFKKAKEYFEKALQNGNKTVLYNLETFNKIGNKKIKVIENITEFQEVENDVGGVLMHPKHNLDIEAHSLYDIETFCKIKKEINELLKDIPEVLDDKSNEVEVFKKICKKIADNYSYDNIYLYSEKFEDLLNMITGSSIFKIKKTSLKIFSSRNLIGVLNYFGVCAFFAELLRNMCACRNIMCIYVGSKSNDGEAHAYNFVKLKGIWYPFDITWNYQNIKNGLRVEDILLSQQDFEKESELHVPEQGQYIPEEGLATISYNTQYLVRNALESGVTINALKKVEDYIKYLIEKANNIFLKII